MANNDQTKDLNEIYIDPKSGISEDEQKEILAKINGITENRRKSLSEAAEGTGKKSFKAKKTGNLFPVLVNAAAIAVLAGGFFVLSSFQGRTDVEARIGTTIDNSAERALISEIRRETHSRIEAKESEILLIVSRLEVIDLQLRELHSSAEELTAEQQATENRLIALQNEYRAMLSRLQDERAAILEEARAREAELQALLDRRARDFALAEEQRTAEAEAARNELERLSLEQSQIATVESQMGAFFANIRSQIEEGLLNEAAQTLNSMREFLNTPAFLSLRSIQARRDLYNQTIGTFETMLEEAIRNRAAFAAGVLPPDPEVERELADLNERNADLERQVAAFTAGGAGANRRIVELETTVTSLRSTNTSLEASVRERDGRITSLQSDLNARQTENANLRGELTARGNTINDLDNRITGLQAENTSLQNTSTALQGQLSETRNAAAEALNALQTLPAAQALVMAETLLGALHE